MRLIPPDLVAEAKLVYELAGDQPAKFRMGETQRLALAAARVRRSPRTVRRWLQLPNPQHEGVQHA